MDDNFKDFLDLVNKIEELIKAGIIKDTSIDFALQEFRKRGDKLLLYELLDEYEDMPNKIEIEYNAMQKEKEENPYLPYPFGEEAEKLYGPIEIGIINQNGDIIGLTLQDLTRHIQVYGIPGMGKSVLIYNMILCILKSTNQKKER